MRGLRKHIAFSLFVAFFLPTTFQSLHVIRHHSENHVCKHHCHHILPEKAEHEAHEIISEEVTICPICNYHFSIVDLPEILFFSSGVSSVTRFHCTKITQTHQPEFLTGKSPRAPPFVAV